RTTRKSWCGSRSDRRPSGRSTRGCNQRSLPNLPDPLDLAYAGVTDTTIQRPLSSLPLWSFAFARIRTALRSFVAGWPFGGRTLAEISTSFVAISTSSVDASTVAPFGRDRLSSAMPRASLSLRCASDTALRLSLPSWTHLSQVDFNAWSLGGTGLLSASSFANRAMAAEFAL